MYSYSENDIKDFDQLYGNLNRQIDNGIRNAIVEMEPKNLYDPMKYMLTLKGKRLRPILLMLCSNAVGGNSKDSLAAACAIEIIHNFTLVHDDIMDEDDMRRGNPTVYKKWDENVAILTGDGLIALAYKFLSDTSRDRIKEIIKIFSDGIIKICEGQSLDNDFEKRSYITKQEYLKMISLKTGVLISVSCEIGAIMGNADPERIEILKEFGMELGIAFQVQDDLFDIFSSEDILGKDIGSDLQKGKKSYPVILFMEKASVNEKVHFNRYIKDKNIAGQAINDVRDMLTKYEIDTAVTIEVNNRIDKSQEILERMESNSEIKYLMLLCEKIRNRKY